MILDRIQANARLGSTAGFKPREGRWTGIRARVAKAATAFAFLLSATVPMALGQAPNVRGLDRVGPVDSSPSGGGYPAWYQDKTGLALEFCSPKTDAELIGGWCVLLPPDLTTTPESFPTNFFDEHFYFLANAQGNTASGAKAKLVLGLEGAFGGGPALAGDQIVFARVRAVITGLPAGDYAVLHPYGRIPANGYIHIDPADQKAAKFFVTQDVGVGCTSGPFDCAKNGDIGPFLQPSDTPGGAQLGPTAGPGGLYIDDPNRNGGTGGPITGSPVNQNFFRIVQSSGAGETTVFDTTTFTLNGRIHSGPIPAQVTVNRAIYSDDRTTKWVDVFATAQPATQARIPPNAAVPGKATPQLQYYLGACNEDAVTHALSSPGGTAFALTQTSSGNTVWGEHDLPTGYVSNICVQDTASNQFYGAPVSYEVSTQASHDGTNLRINAQSSDVTAALFYNGASIGTGTGSATIATPVPPETVLVSSTGVGAGTGQARVLVTAFKGNTTPSSPVLTAQNLVASVATGATVTIDVPNGNAPGTSVTIGSTPDAPKLGSATVGATNNILYKAGDTPGTDSFTYQLNNSTATVTVTITGSAPPPGDAESLIVSAANYRGDQARWQINGTDSVASNQVLTIKNITKNQVLGPATVPVGGAWTFDIRNRPDLAPNPGDQVVAINGNVTSAPLAAAIRK